MNQTYGPYSPITQAGNLYYTAGQIGVDPDNGMASRGIAEQTTQALENLAVVLQSAGLTMQAVKKTTVFVTDISQFQAVNEVYEQFFQLPRPARSTVEVAALPNVADVPLLVEIEAVAYKEKS